jgi:hypothetical protein
VRKAANAGGSCRSATAKIENTVRDLGVEADDTLGIAEKTDA